MLALSDDMSSNAVAETEKWADLSVVKCSTLLAREAVPKWTPKGL